MGEDVELGAVPGGSVALRGYLARPAGHGPWPGVVVVHEAWGLDPVMRRQADRMARAGYVTLAPNLYSNGGPRCVAATLQAMVTGKGPAFADIEACRVWLSGHAECTGKVGVIGFCMGGAFALLPAARGFDVAADNYGMVPRHPERVLADACPIVASYGRRDIATPGAAQKLETTLTRLDVEHDVKQYPTAGHSFLNDAMTGPRVLRPLLRVTGFRPDPVAAEDAWERIEAFFAQHLS
jgi:carboxymethylenebutenolidase